MLAASLRRTRAAHLPLRRALAASAAAPQHKVVRTDAEQCVPNLMGGPAARGCELVELPEVGHERGGLH